MVRVEGREGRQPSYAIAGGAALYNLSLQRKHLVYNLFCCPECKEDFGSESVLDKHKIKFDVYDNILEDIADIPFKLSDRIGKNH